MSVWISPQELAELPKSGAAYDAVKAAATGSWGTAKVSDQNSTHDVNTLAGAIISAVNSDAALKTKTYAALASVPGTEAGGRTLALGRNLAAYVCAADISGYREPAFVAWVDAVRKKTLDGMTLIQCQERRGNNWGTMASGALISADAYLGDKTDLARAVKVFKGWLGDRTSYAGFKWGGIEWQANRTNPVGINAQGSTINGKNVDGVLPDDQRRARRIRLASSLRELRDGRPRPCPHRPRGSAP